MRIYILKRRLYHVVFGRCCSTSSATRTSRRSRPCASRCARSVRRWARRSSATSARALAARAGYPRARWPMPPPWWTRWSPASRRSCCTGSSACSCRFVDTLTLPCDHVHSDFWSSILNIVPELLFPFTIYYSIFRQRGKIIYIY